MDTVGIGVPGLFDAELGVATFLPNLPGDWEKVPLVAHVADALGAPAALINDARAFALAESELGAARGCDTAVFVAVGTGVGGGITVGGRFHEGRAGRAGEIGHMTIAEKGPPCTCGNRGCVEALVREALAARRLRRAGQLLGIGSRTRSRCSRPTASSSAAGSAPPVRSCSSRSGTRSLGAASSPCRSRSCRRSWA